MKKERLYFTRYYDQWRGKDIELVEDEKDIYDLYIQVPDMDMTDGSINTIMANFSTSADEFIQTCFCEVFDASKRIMKLTMPIYILANNGLYKVNFEISYNQVGSDKTNEKTAIQTFTIIDSIDITDGGLSENISEDRYNELIKAIEKLAEYKVDTSNYATKEELNSAIEDALRGVSLENIIARLEGKYVTPEQFNEALKNYITKFDSSQFAKASDLNKFITSFEVTNNYVTKSSLDSKLTNYVVKQEGKDLSTNDFTDALKNKLVNLPENGSDYDDTELKDMIAKKADVSYVEAKFREFNSIDAENYYDIDEMETIFEEIEASHNKDMDSIKEEIETTYFKKEDYKYENGVNIDDVYVDETVSLNDLIEELRYEEIEIKDFNTNFITNIFESGTVGIESVTFNWELNKTPISQRINGEEISTDLTSHTLYMSISDSIVFTLTVADEKVEKETTLGVYFVKPYLYGTHAEDYLSPTTIEFGEKIIDKKGNQTITLSYKDSKVFFAYPLEYGYLSEIKDNNGFSYINDFMYEIMYINDTDYLVYNFNERVSVKNISFTFFFEEEEE